jgi:hypothetical protein
LKALNRKAEQLVQQPVEDVRPYAVNDCCPGFLPGWEVGAQNASDPCGWQNDLPACHPCYWSAQVPDNTTYPDWLDGCQNVARDWQSLPLVGP